MQQIQKSKLNMMISSKLSEVGQPDGRIRFAIPSVTSRLHLGSAQILNIPAFAKNAPLVISGENLTLFQFRGTDIPQAVARGWVDCGLCGVDAVVESRVDISVLQRFPETTTRIALIEPARKASESPKDTYSVVTEYPIITRSHLESRYKEVKVWKVHGSSESFAFLDDVDGVTDIVDTGNTLRRNGLILREVIFETCICLVAKSTLDPAARSALFEQIQAEVKRIAAMLPPQGSE